MRKLLANENSKKTSNFRSVVERARGKTEINNEEKFVETPKAVPIPKEVLNTIDSFNVA